VSDWPGPEGDGERGVSRGKGVDLEKRRRGRGEVSGEKSQSQFGGNSPHHTEDWDVWAGKIFGGLQGEKSIIQLSTGGGEHLKRVAVGGRGGAVKIRSGAGDDEGGGRGGTSTLGVFQHRERSWEKLLYKEGRGTYAELEEVLLFGIPCRGGEFEAILGKGNRAFFLDGEGPWLRIRKKGKINLVAVEVREGEEGGRE